MKNKEHMPNKESSGNFVFYDPRGKVISVEKYRPIDPNTVEVTCYYDNGSSIGIQTFQEVDGKRGPINDVWAGRSSVPDYVYRILQAGTRPAVANIRRRREIKGVEDSSSDIPPRYVHRVSR